MDVNLIFPENVEGDFNLEGAVGKFSAEYHIASLGKNDVSVLYDPTDKPTVTFSPRNESLTVIPNEKATTDDIKFSRANEVYVEFQSDEVLYQVILNGSIKS